MIIFRYLSKQILQVLAATSVVLLVVAVATRFVRYLADAVAGKLTSEVLLMLMVYRLPDFLMVILPLSLFLAIIIAYGRMYAENEMVILMGSGFSQRRLLAYTLGTSFVVLLIIAALSLYLAPWGVRQTEQIKLSQQQLTEIDLIVAGQFQSFSQDSRITYAERISTNPDGSRRLENVFVALNSEDEGATPRILFAETARPEIEPVSGARFMRLENVLEYDGEPGSSEFVVSQFDALGILLPEPAEIEGVLEETTIPTRQLLGSSDPVHQAELQWRISMLLLIPVITLIAVPMSKVSPRDGRYSKLLPAAMIYAAYFVILKFVKDLMVAGTLDPAVGLWWIHLGFVLLGIAMFRFPDRLPKIRFMRAQ